MYLLQGDQSQLAKTKWPLLQIYLRYCYYENISLKRIDWHLLLWKKITISIHIQPSRDPCILLQIWQKVFSRKIKLSICWVVKNNSTPMNWNTEGCGKSNLKSIKIATFWDQKQLCSSVISRETWWRRSRLKLHVWNSDRLYYLEKKIKKGTWFWPLF